MPAPKLYGVIDCARDPALYPHVQRLWPECADCLFEGRLDEAVRAVSPFIVELSPADPLSRAWRGQGWGQAWGVLMSSREPRSAVRRQLRRFTQARLPDGSGPMLFRFWDPRVFRVYLPLVEPQAIDGWFKAVDRYIVETEDGAGALRYQLRNGALAVENAPRPVA